MKETTIKPLTPILPNLVGSYSNTRLTSHAIWRMNQRNMDGAEVKFIIQYGKKEYRAGAIIHFLGKRQIPTQFAKEFGYLEGAVVLVSSVTGEVLTVYRNRRHGLKNHLRKTKYCRYRKLFC